MKITVQCQSLPITRASRRSCRRASRLMDLLLFLREFFLSYRVVCVACILLKCRTFTRTASNILLVLEIYLSILCFCSIIPAGSSKYGSFHACKWRTLQIIPVAHVQTRWFGLFFLSWGLFYIFLKSGIDVVVSLIPMYLRLHTHLLNHRITTFTYYVLSFSLFQTSQNSHA